MTHNIREGIEEVVEELKKLAKLIEEETYFLASDKQRGLSGTQHAVAKDNLSSQFNKKLNTLTQSLHQELQKARDEVYKKLTDQLYGMNLNITMAEQQNMFRELDFVYKEVSKQNERK